MLMKVAIFSDCFCALIIPHRNTVAFKTIYISVNKYEMLGAKCILPLRNGLSARISHRCAVHYPDWPVSLSSSMGSQTAGRSPVHWKDPCVLLNSNNRIKKERKTKHYCSCDFPVRPAHTPHVNVTPCLIQPLAVHLCCSLDDRSADLFSDGANHE